MSDDRPILVTGANGFIGSHLVRALLGRGDRVRALVRRTSRLDDLDPAAEVAVGDVVRPSSLPAAVEGVRAVYHVAGCVKSRRPATYHEVNGQGTRSLVLACRKVAPDLERFVLVSSLAAAGPARQGRPVRESDPARPVSEYGRSKRAGERHALAQAGSIPVTVVRPPVVYGPRDTGVLAFFQIAARGFRPVFSNEKYYSIIHVSDLVRGTLLAGESERAVGRIYHIANRTAPSFSELFRLISAEVGRTTRPLPLPTGLLPLVAASVDALSAALGLDLRPLRDKVKDIAPDYWIADTTRAVADLGFRARIPLAEGFAETARGYRRLGWIPRMDTAV